jgi:hypothetical protein
MADKNNDGAPSRADIQNFLLIEPLIGSLMDEMKELSKKKPDGLLNKLKVSMINKRLKPMKDLVRSLPIAQFLDELDEESLPSNSDTVLIVGQFTAALKAYRTAFRGHQGGRSGWFTDEGFIEDGEIRDR